MPNILDRPWLNQPWRIGTTPEQQAEAERHQHRGALSLAQHLATLADVPTAVQVAAMQYVVGMPGAPAYTNQ